MQIVPGRLHQTHTGRAAPSGLERTPFGAMVAAFMQAGCFQAGMDSMLRPSGFPVTCGPFQHSFAPRDVGTPSVTLQLNRKPPQRSSRSDASAELVEYSCAPTGMDDSGSEDLAELDADMTASKKAVATLEHDEQKAAAATTTIAVYER